jgi:hypothetical protein
MTDQCISATIARAVLLKLLYLKMRKSPRCRRAFIKSGPHSLQLVTTIERRLVEGEWLSAMRLVLLRLGACFRRCGSGGRRRSLSECDRSEHRCNESNCEFLHVILQGRVVKMIVPRRRSHSSYRAKRTESREGNRAASSIRGYFWGYISTTKLENR